MPLLALKDIGKIYVSKTNVTVGIRGVNLSFDRGEFVAITGQSGSGKSTLLNVISGMDTYEEGEMLIEGNPTSHFLQPEWEEYREKYISFIFQDYNIIESFTVLQNVELALMHIEDVSERRKRAIELLSRVGMKSHLNHKGSKLSGGQKQRTVIARALAKDSPIILADEPTGNLDSETSREIIELLREVSRDKLLIVVTHNFDEVEACATRHIRVFDGSVETDRILIPKSQVEFAENNASTPSRVNKKTKSDVKNGWHLGKAMFTARPKLSVFLCLLMIIGTLGIFLITGSSGEAASMFDKNYMFSHIDGRVIFTEQNGVPIGDENLKKIAEKYGAEKYLYFDVLLDDGERYAYFPRENKFEYDEDIIFNYTYGEDFGSDIIGRYPKEANEVILSLPISYMNYVGRDLIVRDKIVIDELVYKIVGVHYYVDNNIVPKCQFTEEGFKIATAIRYLTWSSQSNIYAEINGSDGNNFYINFYRFIPNFDVDRNKMSICDESVDQFLEANPNTEFTYNVYFNSSYYVYDYYYGMSESIEFSEVFGNEAISDQKFELTDEYEWEKSALFISPYLLLDVAEKVLNSSYRQASLFFEDDDEAERVAEEMMRDGYIAVASTATYSPDTLTVITKFLTAIFSVIMWVLTIVFLAFFINLCSMRALDAFKSDMAIMRSMGIPVKTIKIGMYVRMLIALIPAYIAVIAIAILVYTTPAFNSLFTYLYAWQYAAMFVGVLLLAWRVTKKQIGRLFGESVKKSLKGGEEQ